MNLVAKEYIAAQNPDDLGVLILSRFAGAAHECKAALLVNPYESRQRGDSAQVRLSGRYESSSSEWWPRLRWAEPENARYRRPHAHGNNINSRQLIKIG